MVAKVSTKYYVSETDITQLMGLGNFPPKFSQRFTVDYSALKRDVGDTEKRLSAAEARLDDIDDEIVIIITRLDGHDTDITYLEENKVSAFTVATANGFSGVISGTMTNPILTITFENWLEASQSLTGKVFEGQLSITGKTATSLDPAYSGGSVLVSGGDSYFANGGTLTITGGDGDTSGGDCIVSGGEGNVGPGGLLIVSGGYSSSSTGGNLILRGGQSASASYGSITCVTGPDGSEIDMIKMDDNGSVGRLGFYGATPVVQPVAGTGLDVVLANLGLRVAGSPNALNLNKTLTATVGNVTIDKVSGQVNMPALGTSLTLTNSLITANSLILLSLGSNPGVNIGSLYAVAVAGSCTINVFVAVANQTKINFLVIN